MQGHFIDFGVDLVTVAKMGEYLDLLTVELVRPVAMFTGIPGRAQMFNRGRDRPAVAVSHNCQHLAQTRDLGLDKPFGTGSDVAFNTGYLDMGRPLVGSIFRSHDFMAHHAAEIGRVGKMITFVSYEDKNRDIDDGQDDKAYDKTAVLVIA